MPPEPIHVKNVARAGKKIKIGKRPHGGDAACKKNSLTLTGITPSPQVKKKRNRRRELEGKTLPEGTGGEKERAALLGRGKKVRLTKIRGAGQRGVG